MLGNLFTPQPALECVVTLFAVFGIGLAMGLAAEMSVDESAPENWRLLVRTWTFATGLLWLVSGLTEL